MWINIVIDIYNLIFIIVIVDESQSIQVSVEMVMKQMVHNADICTKVLLHVIPMIAAKDFTTISLKYEVRFLLILLDTL